MTVQKLPPASPDLRNPIENAWAELEKRLRKTDPGTLETEAAFKARATNGVKWLVDNNLWRRGACVCCALTCPARSWTRIWPIGASQMAVGVKSCTLGARGSRKTTNWQMFPL